MNYPANQIMALLRVYDAFHEVPGFVDAVVAPAMKPRIEAFLHNARNVEPDAVHIFRNSLARQFSDAQVGRTIVNVQNLEISIDSDQTTMTLSWYLLSDGRRNERLVQIDLRRQTPIQVESAVANNLVLMGYLTQSAKTFSEPLK